MKKNLQLALAITLGFATTVSAQDWSVDSRTRVTNNDAEMSTDQRVRLGLNFGGDAVSVHTSFNAGATLGDFAGQTSMNFGVREAYASTDLMGYASVSAGRMALNIGSGRVIGDNDWTQGNGNTWDGFMFGINNDFADINFGYAAAMDSTAGFDGSSMMVNMAKEMGDMSFNVLYMTTSVEGMEDNTTMALEGSYAMSNGATLSFGHYTNDDGSEGGESGLTSVGATYGVNDNISINAGYDMYDDNGFYSADGSFGGADFQFGNALDYSNMDGCTDMNLGGSYTMGNISVGATMHMVEADATDVDDARDFSTMEFNLGYSLSDNSSLSMNFASSDETEDDATRMWMSLSMAF